MRPFPLAVTAACVTAAAMHASERSVTVKRRASSGEGGVHFNDTVSVLTVTT